MHLVRLNPNNPLSGLHMGHLTPTTSSLVQQSQQHAPQLTSVFPAPFNQASQHQTFDVNFNNQPHPIANLHHNTDLVESDSSNQPKLFPQRPKQHHYNNNQPNQNFFEQKDPYKNPIKQANRKSRFDNDWTDNPNDWHHASEEDSFSNYNQTQGPPNKRPYNNNYDKPYNKPNHQNNRFNSYKNQQSYCATDQSDQQKQFHKPWRFNKYQPNSKDQRTSNPNHHVNGDIEHRTSDGTNRSSQVGSV
jgi:hypothetical protein